jgi:hypothetical protein
VKTEQQSRRSKVEEYQEMETECEVKEEGERIKADSTRYTAEGLKLQDKSLLNTWKEIVSEIYQVLYLHKGFFQELEICKRVL